MVVQENYYYPFGGSMRGLDYLQTAGKEDKYQYNGGAEKNTDFGLNLYETQYRLYDPLAPRFLQIDPKADEEDQESWTPYHYGFNNPVLHNDPDGLNPIRGAIAAYRYAKKIYKIYEKVGNRIDKLTKKHFKEAGIEELYGIAGDIFTLFDKQSSGWDRAKAAVDLILGSEFNKKGEQAVVKALDEFKDKAKGVYYNKHKSGKSYVGKGNKKRADDSGEEKAKENKDALDKNESSHYGSESDNTAKEEEAISIYKNGVNEKNPTKQYNNTKTYNKIVNGRSRVNQVFGGGKYNPKTD